MRYRVRHQTAYRYAEDVSLSHSLVTCQPRNTERQHCLSNETWIEPTPTFWDKRRDALGNWVGYFSLEERHRQLTIVCRSLVEVTAPPRPGDPGVAWESVDPGEPALYQFLYPTPWTDSEDCKAYAAASFTSGRSAWEAVSELTGRIHQDFRYLPGSTMVSTPISQVMRQRQGVCQDFAHVLVSGLRAHGLPARYVSGYLLTSPPPGQPRLVGADASHAWVSVWLPAIGWIDFDPTNNCLTDDRYVVLAWGRDYHEVAPVRGIVLGGGRQQIRVGVDVTPE